MANMNDLYPLVLILGVSAILVVLFLVLLEEISGMDMVGGTDAETLANDTRDALAGIIDWLPLLIIIVVIAIVLGLVIGSLVIKGSGQGGF